MHITWGHRGCRRPKQTQPVTSSFIIIPHCHAQVIVIMLLIIRVIIVIIVIIVAIQWWVVNGYEEESVA